MELTLALVQKISSLSILILLGFLSVRTKLMTYEGSRALSQFGLNFLTPCAVLEAFQYEFELQKLSGMGFVLLASLLTATLFALLGNVFRRTFTLNTVETLSLEFPNVGNFMIPLVAGTMGEEWVIYLCPCVFVFNLFAFSYGQSAMAGARKISLSMLYKNVVIICSFIGLALFLFNWKIPGVLGEAVHSMSSMMGPVYMFTVGMIMGHADLKKVFRNRKAWFICLGRLLVFPVATLLLLKVCGISALHPYSREILAIVVLASGAPVAVTITQFAQMYADEQASVAASTINILSTLLCLLTMPCISALYQRIA